jgi:hypothetical protein
MKLSEFRELLRSEKESATYNTLVDKYGVNRYYLCNIVNDKPVKLPSKVRAKLGILRHKPRPRRAINLADAGSAAETIIQHGGAEYAVELMNEIERRIG